MNGTHVVPEATAGQFLSWIGGLDHEVGWWGDLIRSRGLGHEKEFQARLHPSRPAPAYLTRPVARCERTPVCILDVGSGPLSPLLSYQWPCPVKLQAVDPLARIYGDIADREKLPLPIPPELAFAEDLSAFVPAESFDIVHSSNALDHSFDPLRAIWEMIHVTRVGGTVVLLHYRNEAEKARYVGLHQWNFDVREGRALLWNPHYQHDLRTLLDRCCEVTAERVEWPVDADKPDHLAPEPSILVYIRKLRSVDFIDDVYRSARCRDLLTALMEVGTRIPVSMTARQHLRRRTKELLLKHAPGVLQAYRKTRQAFARVPSSSAQAELHEPNSHVR